ERYGCRRASAPEGDHCRTGRQGLLAAFPDRAVPDQSATVQLLVRGRVRFCDRHVDGGESDMLTMTDNAVAAIRSLTGQPEVPEGAGLRIATDPAAGALQLSVAPAPHEGDQVLDSAGARLFLDTDAALLLDDKALDATVDEQGAVQFA